MGDIFSKDTYPLISGNLWRQWFSLNCDKDPLNTVERKQEKNGGGWRLSCQHNTDDKSIGCNIIATNTTVPMGREGWLHTKTATALTSAWSKQYYKQQEGLWRRRVNNNNDRSWQLQLWIDYNYDSQLLLTLLWQLVCVITQCHN